MHLHNICLRTEFLIYIYIYWDGTYIRYIYILTICKSIKTKQKGSIKKLSSLHTTNIYTYFKKHNVTKHIQEKQKTTKHKKKQRKNHHKNGNIFSLFLDKK